MIWKNINGFESYQVSDCGKIRSNGVIRSKKNCRAGYVNAHLYKNGKRKSIGVHRIVYETFIGPLKKGMSINHKDGNKENNTVKNLEQVTPIQNTRHGIDNGLIKVKGAENGMAKIKERDVLEIRSLRGKLPQSKIAEAFKISQKQVCDIQLKKRWRHL
jgi:hypothetical protein